MLTVDDYGKIRRAYRDGLSIRQICRTFGHSHHTVRKALSQPEPRPYQRAGPPHCPVLGPYHEVIDQILADDEHAPPKQRHTRMQVYRRLVDEYGYTGGYDAVRRYIGKLQHRQRVTYIPLDYEPGVRMECDFGHIQVDFPAGRRQVPVLICTWAWSNAPFAIALPTERTEAILAGMVAAFERFGVVPWEVWWDNPKTVATAILKGRERRLHERYAALASWYCFEPRFCQPGCGNEKPHVENRVFDLQRRYATPVPKVGDLDALNRKLQGWCQDELGRTVQGQTEPIGRRFEADRQAALDLPPRAFEACVRQEALVDKYQRVRYDNVRYSVPPEVAFQPVTVKAGIDRIEVVYQGRTVASHPRSYEPGTQQLDPLHYLPRLHRRSAALDHAPVFRHWQLPAVFEQLREHLEQRLGPPAGRRRYVEVLQLLLDHPQAEVEQVVAQHLARGLADVGAVRLAVERRRLPDTATPDLSRYEVPAPDLTRFDQLLQQGEPCHA